MTSACFLVGKQNSSKAGFTKLVYWKRTFSKSLPRSSMSRNTLEEKKNPLFFQLVCNKYSFENLVFWEPYLVGPGVCLHPCQRTASYRIDLSLLCSKRPECLRVIRHLRVGWWQTHRPHEHWFWNRRQAPTWTFQTECLSSIATSTYDQMHLQ